MAVEDDFESLRDELYRRIGRNLVTFHHIEQMLKYIVSTGKISGPVAKLAGIRESHRAKVGRSTMGKITERFIDEFLSGANASAPSPSGSARKGAMSFTLSLDLDPKVRKELRKGFAKVVKERNELVHHLHEHWDGLSVESTKNALEYLEAQSKRVLPIFDFVRGTAQALQAGLKWHADDLNAESKRAAESGTNSE